VERRTTAHEEGAWVREAAAAHAAKQAARAAGSAAADTGAQEGAAA
jgi:ring-1,2-phenylacetyl-CoA epoxidase subunit PaaA